MRHRAATGFNKMTPNIKLREKKKEKLHLLLLENCFNGLEIVKEEVESAVEAEEAEEAEIVE